CCLPVLYWNARNGWVTVRHVGWQAGLERREGWLWLGPLAFVGGQFGLLLGYWFVVWACALWAYRPGRTADPNLRYLWWTSAPTFGVFLLASLRTSGQLNWAVAAYLSGMVLAAAWLTERRETRRQGEGETRRMVFLLVSPSPCLLVSLLGLILTLVTHYPALARPLFLALAGPPTPNHPLPLRRFDPTSRLRGWRALAAEVDRLRAELRAAGGGPVLGGAAGGPPGAAGVLLARHPP